MPGIALVTLNMGGPDCLDAVEPYIRNILSDRSVIRLPFGAWAQGWFARRIAARRAPRVRRQYATLGGRSPLIEITLEQTRLLCAELGRRGIVAAPFVAMRYWHPTTDEAVAAIRAGGFDTVVALSLYPHACSATTGSSFLALGRALAEAFPTEPPRRVDIESFATDTGYVQALAGTVRAGLAQYPPERQANVVVLFSAHGVPISLVRRGDPYVDQVRATVAAVRAALPPLDAELAFQSRAGPVRWVGPETSATLQRLGAAGRRDVLVVPVSFVSDHLETLHELDIELAAEAAAWGISGFVRAPALNTRPDFIAALGAMVQRALATAAVDGPNPEAAP